jgi:hypothetical protein
MNNQNIYYPIWKKYKPAIVSLLKASLVESQKIQMFKHEFEVFGNRVKSNYIFNLEIVDGVCVNDTSGTAVARDLLEILNTSDIAKSIFSNHHIKINMGKDFIMHIQNL